MLYFTLAISKTFQTNLGMSKNLIAYLALFSISFLTCKKSETRQNIANTQNSHTFTPQIQQLNQLLTQHPDLSDLWYQRGQKYYELDIYDQAIEDLHKAVDLDRHHLDAWHLLADSYLDNLQSRQALEIMESARNIFADSTCTLLKLAEYQLILKRYSEAHHTLQDVLNQDPDNADAYFLKGMVYRDSKDTSSAILLFQMATREDPHQTDAWINIGQLLETKGDLEAERYFDAGLSVAPDNWHLLHAKAQYLGRAGRSEEAKILYRQMLDQNAYDATPYFDLGLIYLDQDSLELALEHFELAKKLEPAFARAHFYHGYVSELQGDNSAALADYNQTLLLNPEDKDAADRIAVLQRKPETE